MPSRVDLGLPMVKCPKCGEENPEPAKEWIGGKGTSKPMRVQRFVCASCRTSYVAWEDKSGKLKTMMRKV